ncbi:hypothetical protein FVF58_03105 [Paraburkholderia panacisoli]|uniref:Uncharacterized protein n=1 Tax=Paraburkholderia panacisoli TaxID=2603818 RepID=A0A5B0HIH3_9BURK|nr:VPA1267 family protein [Paraburkholderia panacisoli]KAA1014927.1 hypothetical protein FVF58_03105 [Paraburkholderia panacisoli]
MANGQQIAEQNLVAFEAWLATKTENEFRAMASRGVLSRKEIAKECGFAQSALSQNPRIKAVLKAKEDELRAAGVLPPLAQKTVEAEGELPLREAGRQRASMNTERLNRLELDNAALRAENEALKRKLEKYTLLDEALATTGRLLR